MDRLSACPKVAGTVPVPSARCVAGSLREPSPSVAASLRVASSPELADGPSPRPRRAPSPKVAGTVPVPSARFEFPSFEFVSNLGFRLSDVEFSSSLNSNPRSLPRCHCRHTRCWATIFVRFPPSLEFPHTTILWYNLARWDQYTMRPDGAYKLRKHHDFAQLAW